MNYLITYTVLGAVALASGRWWLRRHDLGLTRLSRALAERDEREAALAAFRYAQASTAVPAYTQADADAEWRRVIHAIREEPCQNLAWGAPALERLATGADQPDNPGLFLPSELDDLKQWQAELEDQL